MILEGYVNIFGKWLEENGFYEKEIYCVMEIYGIVIYVFSIYEFYCLKVDKELFVCGINSI